MSTEADQSIAIMDRLNAWSVGSGVPVARIQEPSVPGAQYVRVWQLRAVTQTLGSGGDMTVRSRRIGILQISVFTELAKGDGPNLRICEQIEALFARARLLDLVFEDGRIRLFGDDEGRLRQDLDIPYYWDVSKPIQNT